MKAFWLIPLFAVGCAAWAAETTRLKADERVVFYPSLGQRVNGGREWRIEVRGCVFEPAKRGLFVGTLREALELKNVELSADEEGVFNERARLFLVDNERGKRIFIRAGGQVFAVGRSKADGTFAGEFRLPGDEVRRLRGAPANDGFLRFSVELPPGDSRRFAGEALLLDKTGLSVISDIDDTIKITEVRDRRATLRNTFLREFRPVPDMAAFYQAMARSNDAAFHYVSASPWPLYEPLAAFVHSNGFPAGTFVLKDFRWKNRSALNLLTDPEKYKPAVIEPLLKRFPNRRFILVGDSGERDPEIYAALARKFPRQIERIYIRDVTGESAGAPRYASTFASLPPARWKIFHDPAELR